jgi:hypothetical protein
VLSVYPAEDPVEARVAIPGEKIVFLVVVNGDRPVNISTKLTGTGNGTVSLPGPLAPGVVGEVALVTDQADGTLSLTIRADDGQHKVAETRTVQMTDMADERAADAQPYFELWSGWLQANRPDLGITSDTQWDPEFVSTFLVVSHYAYWSDDWEMVVAWHNMIPPDDWTDVFLRRRGVDTTYTIGYRMDSVSAQTAPHPNDLPDVLIR